VAASAPDGPSLLTDDLLLGCATSAMQIEGGDVPHTWARWCDSGRVRDGAHTRDAVGHWERIDEDVALLASLHQQTYRMGVEWARIEPEPGRLDQEALERYRHEIAQLRARGIVPLVTLHHFADPLWIADGGGWLREETIRRYVAYVSLVVGHLGDLVSDWITINEPNVYAVKGYLWGHWPPGRKSPRLAARVIRNMLRAHIRAYRHIHTSLTTRRGSRPRVGVAQHYCVFEPSRAERVSDRVLSRWAEAVFQTAALTVQTTGRFPPPFGANDCPEGAGRFLDFVGVNYYRRNRLHFRWNGLMDEFVVPDGAPTNDLGWEVYPEGLYAVCRDCHRRAGAPVFVTENGIADAGDRWRARFLYDHLRHLLRARQDGVPVERYYHWTLMDNFELADGFAGRFGLVHVDHATKQRTVRPSGRYYARLCSNRILEEP
jgi:beta-glucosidase